MDLRLGLKSGDLSHEKLNLVFNIVGARHVWTYRSAATGSCSNDGVFVLGD
jgi:hypothetical protein